MWLWPYCRTNFPVSLYSVYNRLPDRTVFEDVRLCSLCYVLDGSLKGDWRDGNNYTPEISQPTSCCRCSLWLNGRYLVFHRLASVLSFVRDTMHCFLGHGQIPFHSTFSSGIYSMVLTSLKEPYLAAYANEIYASSPRSYIWGPRVYLLNSLCHILRSDDPSLVPWF